MPSEYELIFSDCYIYVYPVGLGKKRLSLFETQIINHGGKLINEPKGNLVATHIVVDDSVTQNIEKLKADLNNENCKCNERTKVVRTQWLSKCLKEKKLAETCEYEVSLSYDKNIIHHVNTKNFLTSIQENSSSSESVQETNDTQLSPPKKLKADIAQTLRATMGQHNQLIIGELQKLADAFRSSGDQWRAHGYDKAISAIKAYGKEITKFEDVASLPNIGQRMAAKIQEILEFGKLRKVDEICNDEKVKVVELFTKVWGVGPATAESWYLQVREAALMVEPSLKIMLVGSYRRGKEMCGDVDVLIVKEDNVAKDILTCIITQLKETGFITDDLVSMETNGNQKKYLGLCRLPGENCKHRRLDIFLVPQSEFAPAIMHYTGGALFNRSIRIFAAKKDMSLSEHSLMGGVVREGKNIINQGYVIPTPTEESVFEHLGLQYRPPEDRNHSL
ncbi:DNA polymerase lambda isoform X2 [Anabrus simplex]|uniref:DNA polymerase lambda isoform X2 n=1 Tax=Anabrus simplex TaxID=316456 RepID=UPI0035A2E2A3